MPDCIAHWDDGRHGPLNLIVEVTSEKDKDKAAKIATAMNLWMPTMVARSPQRRARSCDSTFSSLRRSLSSHADGLWWLGLILLAVAVRTAALLLEDHPVSLLWRDPVKQTARLIRDTHAKEAKSYE